MGYSSGDWRTPGQLPPKVASFMQWSQTNPQIQAITADPRYAGNTPAQRRARQAAIHRVIVQAGQHIPEGLKINADGKLETDDQSGIPAWGKALIAGGIAAGAIFGAPALAGALGIGGGGTAAASTGAALGPSTAASMAETAGIVGGSSVPASLAALTPAELAGIGAAGGATGAAVGTSGAGTTTAGTTAAALGPSTPESMAATQAVMQGSTTPASLSTGLGPVKGSSWLGGAGKFLGSTAGGSAISAGAGLLGAHMQASANRDAAQIQTDFLREALDYEKKRDTYAQQLEASRYGDLNSRLTPYISSGQNANARMAQILGLPAPETAPMGNAPTPMGQNQNAAPTYATRTGLDTSGPAEGTAMPRPGGTLMRAPNGSLKQVPPEQVQHYLSLGAQPVNG